MISRHRSVDFILLFISAWAVIATSQDPGAGMGVQKSRLSISGLFAFESDCEDAEEKSGALRIWRGKNSVVLNFASDSPIGLPSGIIFKTSEIEKRGDLEVTYTVQDYKRLCVTTIDDDIFDYAGTTTFVCYDDGSPTVGCSVKLNLLELEESTPN